MTLNPNIIYYILLRLIHKLAQIKVKDQCSIATIGLCTVPGHKEG